MLPTILHILSRLALILCCLIFFLGLKQLHKSDINVQEITRKEINNTLKERGVFKKQELKLSKLGIMYRANDYTLTPSWYVVVRTFAGAVVFLLLLLLTKSYFSILGFPVGYIGLEMYYKSQNKQDNKEILMDLYSTYATLKIQSEAGIYIFDSLEDVYADVQNNRYKIALGELITNLSDKTLSISDALEIFKNRFDSKDIDKLCSLLNSQLIYGVQPSYSKEIMNEINNIIYTDSLYVEDTLEHKSGLLVFCFFLIIILIIGYSLITGFSGIDLFMK